MRFRLCCLLLVLSYCQAQAIRGLAVSHVFYQPQQNARDSAFAEISWQIDPGTISYTLLDSNVSTSVVVQVQITGPGDYLLTDAFILNSTPFRLGSLFVPPITYRHHYALGDSGQYRIELLLTGRYDTATNAAFGYVDSVTVNNSIRPHYSSLQLIDTSFSAGPTDSLSRNGWMRVVKAMPYYDERKLNLEYYTELYHTNQPHADLVQNFFISKKRDGQALPYLVRTDTPASLAVVPVSGSFDLSYLPSGNYYLNARISDQGQVISSEQLFFQLSNSKPLVRADTTAPKTTDSVKDDVYLDLSKTFIHKYNDDQKRAILKMILPIADEIETNSIQGLLKKGSEPVYMAYFIYNFFLKRDAKNPTAAWNTFADKVREVNKLFSAAGKNGYETDRGFVYLKYGKPTERIKVPSEPGALPYEVWRYDENQNISALSFFLFYQPGTSIDDYRLLHSTVPGNTSNPNWGAVLFQGKTDRVENSRAYRYMNNQ